MDFRKKTLSKVFAIALMLACAAAFTPLLTGPAFAAKAKTVKPAKVEVPQLVQADIMTTPNEYDVTASWTKLKKNVAKYKIKIVDVTDPDAKPAPKFMTVKKKKKQVVFSGTVGSTYTVKVRAIKGAKKGAWSDSQTITIAEKRATLTGVTITMPRVNAAKAGDKLTAAVDPADVNVTWQWFRVKGDEATAIDGAVSAEYTVQNADIGFFLKAVASVSEGNLTYAGSAEATTTVAVTTTTSSDGTVIVEPTLEEYTQNVLESASKYSYGDYTYTASQAPNSFSISGNTLTANYECTATLSDPTNPVQLFAAGTQVKNFITGVRNDTARFCGALYRSTNDSASDGPSIEGIDSVGTQNHIKQIKCGGTIFKWLPKNNGTYLKGSNWRVEGSDEEDTLVRKITICASDTELFSTLNGLSAMLPQEDVTPEEDIDDYPFKESDNPETCTFTESITFKAYDDKYPNGYPITIKANITFTQSMFNFIIAPPSSDVHYEPLD